MMRSGLRAIQQSRLSGQNHLSRNALNMQVRPASSSVVKFVQKKSVTADYGTARGLVEAAAVGGVAYGAAQLGSFWTGLFFTGAAAFGTLLLHGLEGYKRDEFRDLGGRLAAYVKTDGGNSETLQQWVQARPELLKSFVKSDDIYIEQLHSGFALNNKPFTPTSKTTDLSTPHNGLKLSNLFRVGVKENGVLKSYLLQTWTPLQSSSKIGTTLNLKIESAHLTPEGSSEAVDVTSAYSNAPITVDEDILGEYKTKAFESFRYHNNPSANYGNGKWDISS